MVVMYALNSVNLLRISKEGEMGPSSISAEHGISAHPEYVISSVVTPVAMRISRDRWRVTIYRGDKREKRSKRLFNLTSSIR